MKSISKVVAIICLAFSVLSIYAQGVQTDKIDVKHYEISLNIDNISVKHHFGYTRIDFDLKTNEHNIVEFSLQNQVVDSVFVGNTQVNTPPHKTNFTIEGNKIRFPLPDYTAGMYENYVAIVYYHGSSTVENNYMAWGGLHYDNDIIYAMSVAFNDYPHSYGRSWFVCNEDFADKATYDFYISVDKDKEAFCSGAFMGKEENETFDTYHYKLTQSVAPYVVSMTIGKFFTYEKTIHSDTYGYDIPLVVKYIYPSDSAKIAKNFSGMEKAFNTLEKHFGKFRFNRVGYTVTPKGSMEHVDNICVARSAILDTSINGVSNIVHELGHSWFGNLATCLTAEDMWLNEGFTTYTTSLTLQEIYGKEREKDYWRQKHQYVLQHLPLEEGVLAVTPIDSSMTYSSTVYEKGAMVAKNIQGYFGDSVFFAAVKAMLDSFAFKNYSSQMVRDFLSEYTNDENFKTFFDCLVFGDKQIDYNMYCEDGIYKFKFNHSQYDNILNIPHTTMYGVEVSDYDERIMSLTTNDDAIVQSDKTVNFPNAFGKIKIENADDTTFVRLILHWTGANGEKLPYGVEKLSQTHYWTLQTKDLKDKKAELSLYFELNGSANSFDNSLVNNLLGKDSVVLLYRKDINCEWIPIEFTIPNNNKGYIKTSFVAAGDYVMARGDKQMVGLIDKTNNEINGIKIYPNPSKSVVNIEVEDFNNTTLTAYSLSGNQKINIPLKAKTTAYKFDVKDTYILCFTFGNKTYSKKILVE